MLRYVCAGGLGALIFLSAAFAQFPGGPGRGPGFGGPRGPQSAVMLLGIPEVRKELGTSETQNKQIDELFADFQEKMRASFAGLDFRELQKLTQEERDKA